MSSSFYLKSLRRHAAQRPVAAAVLQLAARAGARDGVGDAGAGDGVDEAGLPGAGRHHRVGTQRRLPPRQFVVRQVVLLLHAQRRFYFDGRRRRWGRRRRRFLSWLVGKEGGGGGGVGRPRFQRLLKRCQSRSIFRISSG